MIQIPVPEFSGFDFNCLMLLLHKEKVWTMFVIETAIQSVIVTFV